MLTTTAFCVWRSHEVLRVLRESTTSLFHTRKTAALPAAAPAGDTRADADSGREVGSSNGQSPALGVVAAESMLNDTVVPLRKAPDFPLPMPTRERRDPVPIRREKAAIPDSMKNSAPIAPPTVVTVESRADDADLRATTSATRLKQFNEPGHRLR